MKTVLAIVLVLIILYFFKGCKTGYVKKNGDWSWVTIDEQNGKRLHWIEGIDQNSFVVLKNKNFAKDRDQVYFKGKKINHATPDGFELLSDDEYGYSKNHQYAFLNNEVIIGADPNSFVVLEFPYAKDKNDVYCGTIPMKLEPEEVKTFKATNDDKQMQGMISTTKLSHFLELNPHYQWITDQGVEIQHVITGEWGTGITVNRKFKGFKEVR